MKRLLLRMIEARSRAVKGWNYDTWHSGRFLEQWADPRVVEELRQTFAHYDENEVSRALLATMDLFRWLAKEIGERLEFTYPTTSDRCATELVQGYLSTMST